MGTSVRVASKVFFWCVAIAIPLLGMWVSSSLAIYHQRSLRVAIGIGLLAFPALPLVWEAVGEWRHVHAAKPRAHILTLGDRLLLRTFAINLLLLAALLFSRPQEAFAAVSTRGDWMLEDKTTPLAMSARRALFGIAQGLEWLYETAHENPFRKPGDGQTPEPRPNAADPSPSPSGSGARPDENVVAKDPVKARAPDPSKDEPTRPASWPWPATLHPLVVSMPREVETSPSSVARYIADREADPALRIKAIHDWVADRIAYDADAYVTRSFPPQDAPSVFATRRGVCAGYALLFEAMAKEATIESAYVTGDARTAGWDEKGEGHAWNAVKLDGRWHLLDVTWNAGSVDGRTFTKRYRTDYFLTPPEPFGVDHFPDEPAWQLRDKPLTRGEFLRAPIRQPAFFAYGLELVTPDRAQVTVDGALDIVVKNPQAIHFTAMARPREKTSFDESGRCAVTLEPPGAASMRCKFPSRGRYAVFLFANRQPYGTFDAVAELAVNAE